MTQTGSRLGRGGRVRQVVSSMCRALHCPPTSPPDRADDIISPPLSPLSCPPGRPSLSCAVGPSLAQPSVLYMYLLLNRQDCSCTTSQTWEWAYCVVCCEKTGRKDDWETRNYVSQVTPACHLTGQHVWWGDIWIVQLPCELRLRLNHSSEMGEVCIIKRNVSSELYIYLHFRRINSFTVFSAEPYRYLFIYRAQR